MVSGLESGGEVLAVKPFQSHSFGTWQSVTLISLSVAECVACHVYWRPVVSGDLEVLPSIFNTCKNQTEKIPLVDTGNLRICLLLPKPLCEGVRGADLVCGERLL